MKWNRWAIGLVSVLVAACGQAAVPAPSIPPAPPAPAGWTSLGSGGSTEGPAFAGIEVAVSGRPLALHVVCVGTGTLVVRLGDADASGVEEAVTFPCAIDPSVSLRHELDRRRSASAKLSVAGGIVPGLGALSPSAFVISVEEANP